MSTEKQVCAFLRGPVHGRRGGILDKRILGKDLDLYYIHRIDEKVPIEETAGVMKELIEQGKITHWGLSEANEEIIRRAHKICPVTAIQNRSMMYQDYETLFPVLEELNIGFVAFSPLANGFLTGKYDQNTQFEKKVITARSCRSFQKKESERMRS